MVSYLEKLSSRQKGLGKFRKSNWQGVVTLAMVIGAIFYVYQELYICEESPLDFAVTPKTRID